MQLAFANDRKQNTPFSSREWGVFCIPSLLALLVGKNRPNSLLNLNQSQAIKLINFQPTSTEQSFQKLHSSGISKAAKNSYAAHFFPLAAKSTINSNTLSDFSLNVILS